MSFFCCTFARKFAQKGENTMEQETENILKDFERFVKETSQEGVRAIDEVAKSRLKEYRAIRKKVDAEAERLTREELGMPEDEWWFGSCHTFWKHKKRILGEEYHMRWHSPQDLNPTTCFD